MARADLLLDLVRGGAQGDQELFRKALSALITEERAKNHVVLADRLASYLQINGGASSPASLLTRRNGSTADLVHETFPERRIDDLVLPAAVRAAAGELIEEQHRADLLRAHNLEPRNRVLLVGPPGNGKTSLAEVLAAELVLPLLVVRYESVIASYLGETAVRLARLFEETRTRRCVLFFDELDVVGKERGDVHETGEIKRVVSSLLLQIDSLPTSVVVVAASNHPELLDRAVWRRFQLRLSLPAPSPAKREEWFRRFAASREADLGHTPAEMAKKLAGTSYSELEQFTLDLQRRYVLGLPEAQLRLVVSQCLRQWQTRVVPTQVRRG